MPEERLAPNADDEQAALWVDSWRAPRQRVQRLALLAALAGLLLGGLGFWMEPARLWAAYLVAYLFWLGLSLGGLVWTMIYHLTGGRWGLFSRRPLEAAARLIPWAALFFLPLLFGLEALYPWARTDLVEHDALLQHKQPYLNAPFFLGRTVLYFVIWSGLAWLLSRWSRQQDAHQDPALVDRLRRYSGPGLALYGLSITFAAIDWLMSLEPHWFSTIFGVIVAGSQALAALAFVIVLLAWLTPRSGLAGVVTTDVFGDLGGLLLAAVLFWAYLSFVQFLIIWSGNLPEEVVWYLRRLQSGWQVWAVLLVLLGFVLPFAALLSGRLKRNWRQLTPVALLVLVMQWLSLHWMAVPAVQPQGPILHWLDLALLVALGGLWIFGFLWQLHNWPLVARYDWRTAQAGHALVGEQVIPAETRFSNPGR